MKLRKWTLALVLCLSLAACQSAPVERVEESPAQTEPSAATVAFLTEKVRMEALGTVWYIEFSNHLVADSIAEAAGVETAQFHTCHNVSKADLEAGATYLSLMREDLERLREYM